MREVIGDKLVISEYHRENGRKVVEEALPQIARTKRTYTITIAGESGSGKSETAATTAKELQDRGYGVLILAQDDYFKLPPKSNAKKRHEDIGWVGMGEVHLGLMNEHLKLAKSGLGQIVKPLVYFDDDRIGEETLLLDGIDVVIAEGTYTTALEDADFHAFIDATYHMTLAHRKKRARDDIEGAFIEKVLEIEHQIISKHKERAHIVLPPNPES